MSWTSIFLRVCSYGHSKLVSWVCFELELFISFKPYTDTFELSLYLRTFPSWYQHTASFQVIASKEFCNGRDPCQLCTVVTGWEQSSSTLCFMFKGDFMKMIFGSKMAKVSRKSCTLLLKHWPCGWHAKWGGGPVLAWHLPDLGNPHSALQYDGY